jgi:hypothetical protein
MPEKITYYGIMDDDASGHEPRTVLRRRESDTGEVDEIFSRDLAWEFSSLLYSNERGDTTFHFHEICENEADKVVDRVRDEAARRAGLAAYSQSSYSQSCH